MKNIKKIVLVLLSLFVLGSGVSMSMNDLNEAIKEAQRKKEEEQVNLKNKESNMITLDTVGGFDMDAHLKSYGENHDGTIAKTWNVTGEFIESEGMVVAFLLFAVFALFVENTNYKFSKFVRKYFSRYAIIKMIIAFCIYILIISFSIFVFQTPSANEARYKNIEKKCYTKITNISENGKIHYYIWMVKNGKMYRIMHYDFDKTKEECIKMIKEYNYDINSY